MSELFEKSIRVLELPRLLEMLEHHAVSAEAKARARRLTPSDDFGEVNRLLDETDAARKMIMLRGSPAFGGVRDVGEALSRAERGGMLNTRELLDIAGLLTNVRRVQDYYKEDEEGTVIDKLFLSLHPNRFLEEKITTAILDENEIADAASPELAEIRSHKRAAAAKGEGAGNPSDDGDIRHIKQNLKHVGGHQRQTEQQNLPGKPLRRARGDFGFHGILLLGQAFITVFPQTVFFGGGKAEPL